MMIGREVWLHLGQQISDSSYVVLSGKYPSLDLKKNLTALKVGDPVVVKKTLEPQTTCDLDTLILD